MQFKKYNFISILVTCFFIMHAAAHATTGYIDTAGTNTAKVCKDATCTSPTPGSINFELTLEPSIVIDSVTGISGKVWGNELGWITMNPTGQGVTFADLTTGRLTGKAWSQVSGWINFAVTGQNTYISPTTGVFSGWAWTGGPYGGWIKFDCNDSAACVTTTWRNVVVTPPPVNPPHYGHPTDVCPNIAENQETLPAGYTVDANGQCILVPPDVCPNIAGEQGAVPDGYTINSIGACVLEDIDFCPNIVGNQSTIPSNYIVNDEGDCVVRTSQDVCPNIAGIQTLYSQCKNTPVPRDSCSNLVGVQSVVPRGYRGSGEQCFPENTDICPNIPGAQTSIPEGETIGVNGDCIILPQDLCRNLPGSQPEIPKGFVGEDGLCLFRGSITNVTSSIPNGVRVIAFRFIPKPFFIPSNNIIPKSVVKVIDHVRGGTTLTKDPYRVDILSFAIGSIGVLIFLILLFLGIRRIVFRFL